MEWSVYKNKSYICRLGPTQANHEAWSSDVYAAAECPDSAPVGQQARREVGQGAIQ